MQIRTKMLLQPTSKHKPEALVLCSSGLIVIEKGSISALRYGPRPWKEMGHCRLRELDLATLREREFY